MALLVALARVAGGSAGGAARGTRARCWWLCCWRCSWHSCALLVALLLALLVGIASGHCSWLRVWRCLEASHVLLPPVCGQASSPLDRTPSTVASSGPPPALGEVHSNDPAVSSRDAASHEMLLHQVTSPSAPLPAPSSAPLSSQSAQSAPSEVVGAGTRTPRASRRATTCLRLWLPPPSATLPILRFADRGVESRIVSVHVHVGVPCSACEAVSL